MERCPYCETTRVNCSCDFFTEKKKEDGEDEFVCQYCDSNGNERCPDEGDLGENYNNHCYNCCEGANGEDHPITCETDGHDWYWDDFQLEDGTIRIDWKCDRCSAHGTSSVYYEDQEVEYCCEG